MYHNLLEPKWNISDTIERDVIVKDNLFIYKLAGHEPRTARDLVS